MPDPPSRTTCCGSATRPSNIPTPDGYPEEAQPWMATLLWRWKFALDFANRAIEGTSFPAEKLVRCRRW